MDYSEVLKEILGYSVIQYVRRCSGGCINDCHMFCADGSLIFTKVNACEKARMMFDAELYSLKLMAQTNSLRVPQSIKVVDLPEGGAMLVMEHLDIQTMSQFGKELGHELAMMHQFNRLKRDREQESSIHAISSNQYVSQFGFDVTTFIGQIPQENTWMDDWPVR